MPAENIQEVKDYLEVNKESEDVKTFINGYNPVSDLKDDTVHEFLNKTPILKTFYDKHVSKGIETYKENNKNDLDKIKAEAIDVYVKKNYPEITEEQKRIKALELKDTENEKRIKSGEILTTGIEYATAKEIPIDFVKLVVGDSHELTQANLDKIKEMILKGQKTAVEVFIKGHGRKPAEGDVTVDSLQKKYNEAKKAGDTVAMLKLGALIDNKKKSKT